MNSPCNTTVVPVPQQKTKSSIPLWRGPRWTVALRLSDDCFVFAISLMHPGEWPVRLVLQQWCLGHSPTCPGGVHRLWL